MVRGEGPAGQGTAWPHQPRPGAQALCSWSQGIKYSTFCRCGIDLCFPIKLSAVTLSLSSCSFPPFLPYFFTYSF